MLQEHLEHIPCPFCGNDSHRPWGTENGYQAVKCEACGLVYVNPRPAADKISEATRLGQHETESGQLTVTYTYSRRKIRRYAQRIRSLYREEITGNQPMSWLDIGAGFGELVEALQMVLPESSEVVGLEPMQPKVAAARERGIVLQDGDLASIDRQFDAVSLFNILSHLPDVDGFLAQAAGLVKPGGSLLLVTGNGGDLETREEYPDRLDLPDHLLFAGKDHITTFLGRQGLTVERFQARRLDTGMWTVKNAVKRAIGRPAHVVMPYTSRFRDVSFKARKAPPAA